MIDPAIQAIKNGQLIGLPTETVYGLAAPINNETLIKRIFEFKQRPFFDPLIVHVSSIGQAKTLVKHWPNEATRLAQKFWPGPLTLVLKKNSHVSDLITAGLDTVGLRAPAHPIAQKLIQTLGIPLAAPSANLFGKTSPTSAQHVRDSFNDTDVFVLDGGACDVGIESTIVSIENGICKILRPGMISQTDLEAALGTSVVAATNNTPDSPEAPGQLDTHYQPENPLYLFKTDAEKDAFLNKNPTKTPITLKINTNPVIAARELYAALRHTNTQTGDFIVCVFDEKTDSWSGIRNRLSRASTKIKSK